jgi:S1-C subfamily serine protease
VARLDRSAPARSVLQPGDLVLEANGRFVRHPYEVEDVVADGPVELLIVRAGKQAVVTVEPHLLATTGADRVLVWSGAVLQEVPQTLPAQRGTTSEGVYVSWYWYGTPAGRYGLRPSWRIVAVNDTPIEDLDGFLAALGDPEAAVRLTYVDLKGRRKVLTLKPNPASWPTQELRRDSSTGVWSRTQLSL